MTVTQVLKDAVRLGACSQSNKASDWKSLAWLFFSPQGREFCKEQNFPPLSYFRQFPKEIEQYNVFVENNVLDKNKSIALIGRSKSTLLFDDNSKVFKVILMHEAHAIIEAKNYSVVRIENISGTFEVLNDGTAKILV